MATAEAEPRSLLPKPARCSPISPIIRLLVLAVSGGPELHRTPCARRALAQGALKRGPKLVAVTVDHGLRKEAAARGAGGEAARPLARASRIEPCAGAAESPATGLQQAARHDALSPARGGRAQGRRPPCAHRAHPGRPGRDGADAAYPRQRRQRAWRHGAAFAGRPAADDVALVRPLLEMRKARLVATLRKAGVAFADDPSNRDPRFTRARLRAPMAGLAREGLTPERLALLARRVRRAEAALEAVVERRRARSFKAAWPESGAVAFPLAAARPPAGRNGAAADRPRHRLDRRRGPGRARQARKAVRAASLAASSGSARFRRTLAGAVVTCAGDRIVIERAPAGAAVPPRIGLNHSQSSGRTPGTPRQNGLECAGFAVLFAGPLRLGRWQTQTYIGKRRPFLSDLQHNAPLPWRGRHERPGQERRFRMNANLRNFALWVIIVLLLLALFTLFQNPGQRTSSQEISFSQLLTEVDRRQGPRRH